MIKAGDQAGVDGKSGEITADGSYGHYALLDDDGNPITTKILDAAHSYVVSGSDIVDDNGTPNDTSDDLTYRWFGDYVVTNLSGVHNTVRIQVITTYGNIIHDLSHIDYYYECGQVVLGEIQLTKSGLDCDATAYFKLRSGTDYYNTSGIIDNSAAYQGELVTCSPNNVVTWSNLPWGTYTFEETIPAGYTFGGYTPSDTVTIDANNAGTTVEVNATNEEVKAYIKICKEVDESITATEFHFKITGSNIADIPITVDVADKCSDPIGLPLGTYIVEETDIGYTVTIKVDGVEKKKGISPQSVEVILGEGDIGKTITVLFENDPGLGKIKLTKSGLEAGATAYFKLTDGTDYYKTDGKKVTDPTYEGEPVTSSSNEVLWSDMPWGTYTFEETIPAGYTFGGYTPGKTVIIDETNQAVIVAVIATNTKTNGGTPPPPVKTTTVVTVAGVTEEVVEEEVEVLGIEEEVVEEEAEVEVLGVEELLYTGFNFNIFSCWYFINNGWRNFSGYHFFTKEKGRDKLVLDIK